MTIRCLPAITALLLAGLFATSHPAHAAQSYDNCAGTISSLPATISTQGVWCLKGDLSTGITTGNAITINANNVTIDCNDFKLGGLAAGDGSQATGIYGSNKQNATIRHCNVRGFMIGIYLEGAGSGHLVEDNRLDNNLYTGISVYGENNRVRRNAVYDTGGQSNNPYAIGIQASADIDDNTVSGLVAAISGGYLKGIVATGTRTRVSGNIISGFNASATGGGIVAYVRGLDSFGPVMTISGNTVFGQGTTGTGIYGDGATGNFCSGNTVYGFPDAMLSCTDDGNALH